MCNPAPLVCRYCVDELRGRTSRWPTSLKKKQKNPTKQLFSVSLHSAPKVSPFCAVSVELVQYLSSSLPNVCDRCHWVHNRLEVILPHKNNVLFFLAQGGRGPESHQFVSPIRERRHDMLKLALSLALPIATWTSVTRPLWPIYRVTNIPETSWRRHLGFRHPINPAESWNTMKCFSGWCVISLHSSCQQAGK